MLYSPGWSRHGGGIQHQPQRRQTKTNANIRGDRIVALTRGLITGLALLLTLSFLPATIAWAGQTPPGQYKIGVVNLKAVFEGYSRRQDEYGKLEIERATKQKDVDRLSATIEEQKKKYEEQKEKLSDDDRIQLEDEINANYLEYQTRFKALQGDIDRKERRLLDALYKDIRDAIMEVGAQENYHLILEAGEDNPSGVLYSSPTLRMTQKVIDYLNASGKNTKN